jgi:hypothetical protein
MASKAVPWLVQIPGDTCIITVTARTASEARAAAKAYLYPGCKKGSRPRLPVGTRARRLVQVAEQT